MTGGNNASTVAVGDAATMPPVGEVSLTNEN